MPNGNNLDNAIQAKLDNLWNQMLTLGEVGNVVIVGGTQHMTIEQNDYSTHISGGTINQSQFAVGSKDFQGTINNMSESNIEKINHLTDTLIKELSKNPPSGVNSSELIDAVKQVQIHSKQKTINKISISGLLTGINMVMQNADNISTKAISLYNEWSTFIHKIIS